MKARMYEVRRTVKYVWRVSATSAKEAKEMAELDWENCEEERGTQKTGPITAKPLPDTGHNEIEAIVTYDGDKKIRGWEFRQ
jgi:hypothetical protein